MNYYYYSIIVTNFALVPAAFIFYLLQSLLPGLCASGFSLSNPLNPSSAMRMVFSHDFAAQNPQRLTLAYGIKCT